MNEDQKAKGPSSRLAAEVRLWIQRSKAAVEQSREARKNRQRHQAQNAKKQQAG